MDGSEKGLAPKGAVVLGWVSPLVLLGALRRKQALRWSRPLPGSGEGQSGCQVPGCLVAVRVCVP